MLDLKHTYHDIAQYKDAMDEPLQLQLIECYMRLFDEQLHPFLIFIITSIDRSCVSEILKILKDRTPKQE